MQRLSTVGVVLGLALTAGCMTVGTPRAGEPLRLEADDVLVFGKLRVLEGGRSVVPMPELIDELLWPGEPVTFKVSLFGIESERKALYPPYENDGTFWWVVPRGTYLMFHTPPGPGVYNAVLAAFQTPVDADCTYLGTLTVHIDTQAGRANGVEYVVQDVEVSDEFDTPRRDLARRHPGLARPPVEALMFTDEELTNMLSAWSRDRCDLILSRHGLRAFDR